MNGYYDESDDVSLENIGDDVAFSEFFEGDDFERSRSRGGGSKPPPRGARGGGYNQPRPSSQDVTQVQLQALATRIENDMKRLNEVDKTINSRVNAVNTRLDRHALVIKKERRARIKAEAEQNNKFLIAAALPLFLQPKSKTITTTANGLVKDDKVLVEETDNFKPFIPIAIALLGGQLGGLFGSGGLGSGGSSGNSGSSNEL